MKQLKKVGLLLICMLILTGCGKEEESKMIDGTYTAQMADYSYGWREYVTITVKNNVIIAAEYNAENASGFIKSWDNTYMNNMKPVTGTYPNEYTRLYAAQLTGQSKAPTIDTVSGASRSGENFKRLSVAVVNQALKGDSTIAIVTGAKK